MNSRPSERRGIGHGLSATRSSLRIRDLTFAFDDGGPLFGPLTVALAPLAYGLVGANGAGKTTLLRLLAGALSPSSGRLEWVPDDALVVLAAQEIQTLTDDVVSLAERDDRLAQRVKADLALEEGALARFATLSPGERKRWQLGAALAREPDALLLDEPTNHLDADGRARLVTALARLRTLVVIVSHDRGFLDEATRETLRLHGSAPRRLTVTSLPYSEAREAWAHTDAAALALREEQKVALEALHRRHAEATRRVAESTKARSSRARMKDRNDRDATSAVAKMRAERSEGKTSGHAARARRHLEVAAEKLEPFAVDPTLGRGFFVGWARPERRILTSVSGELRRGERVVLRDVALEVARDDRLYVTGPNGAGKTTLVNALRQRWSLPARRLMVLPQELAPEEVLALLGGMRALAPDDRGRVLSCLAALGVDPPRVIRADVLSPGEARKLAMAMGLGLEAWLLLLDEPTNHLDLPSIERLERALEAYPGALVLVSHDERFAERLTRRRIVLPGPVR